VGEQLIVADSFVETKKALIPTVFSGITKEGYQIQGVYNSTNCIYLSRESNANINRLINGLGSVLDNVLEIACEHYYREGGKHGILNMETPPGLSDDETDAYVQEMNDYFEDFFKARNGVAVLFEGMDYKEISNGNSPKNSIITDIREITKEAYSKVAQTIKVPPALLLGDVANITPTVTDNLINYGIMPIMDAVVEKANSVMYTPEEYLNGNYVKVDYANIKYLDALECANNIDKLKADGIYNTNELRVKFGETPVEQDFADTYVLTKNYAEEEGE
jgi:HK97 family phage portal protein